VVFAEADNAKILRAAQIVKEEGTAIPILLGSKEKIQSIMNELNIDLGETTIINPMEEKELRNQFGQAYFEQRQRKGITYYDACKYMRDRNFFGPMMVNMGMADAFVSGLTKNYPNTVRPALRIVGKQDGVNRVAGMYIIMSKRGPMFFADTTININPDWEALTEITVLAYDFVKSMNIEPRIAMLSFNNFGNAKYETPEKIQKAVAWLHKNRPEILVDGEMQANFALNSSLRQEVFPFTKLGDQDVNTFIFPNLAAGNIAYKFAQELGAAESIGPVLLGFKKSVHILQLGSSVREIVNMINIAAVDAQDKS
jgi:malate dehydrogenase (oxaloacetate-decarboxylating)(NADP+)